MLITSYIGLGSNLGDRKAALRKALKALGASPGLAVSGVSSLYETQPWGKPDQPAFLNAVAEVQTQTNAMSLLRLLQGIETDMGRIRRERWGPRTIDLDILLFGREIIAENELTVPHPELARRKFVLVPLAEVNPRAFHPVLGREIGRVWDEAGPEVKEQKLELLEGSTWYA